MRRSHAQRVSSPNRRSGIRDQTSTSSATLREELRLNPEIDATDIAVSVKNGVVALSGFVRSYAQKVEAERTAKRVLGVTGLANDIDVRLPIFNQRPDPDIARDVV